MKVCKVEGCNKKHHAHGYCGKHYMQIKMYGEIRRTYKDPNEIIIHDDYAEIVLLNYKSEEVGRTIIDLDDVEIVSKYKWYLGKNGYVSSKCVATDNKLILLHRLLMDCPDDMIVDHKDINPLNNRKSNLRICTKHNNSMNIGVRENNTSGITGVYWNEERNKWVSSITYNYKTILLGRFNTKEEAIEARKQAEIKYFGEYRCQIDKELD